MYFPVELGYTGHRKVRRLKSLLNDPRADVWPIRLWDWACIYAKDGFIEKYSPKDLAEDLGYDGPDPEAFRNALCDAGWVDRVEGGRLFIHEWGQRGRPGYFFTEQGKAAMRQRKSRAAKSSPSKGKRGKSVTSCDIPVNVTKGSAVQGSAVQISEDLPSTAPANGKGNAPTSDFATVKSVVDTLSKGLKQLPDLDRRRRPDLYRRH